MPQPKCRKQPLSLGRRMLCDYLYFASHNGTAGTERLMHLADVIEARRQASPRPSWGAIMTKAYAIAAAEHPEIRRAYFNFPWGHLGEFSSQIASVIVDRRVGDEDVIFLAPLVTPEKQSLADLDRHLRNYKEEPIAQIRHFREAALVGRMPMLIRRLIWWLGLHVFPRRRSRHFGTFGVTTMSPFGAKTLAVPTLWSTFLHYGTISDNGEVPVGVVFDHRVMDGAVVGYTLMEMEQVLHHQIVAELRSMQGVRAA